MEKRNVATKRRTTSSLDDDELELRKEAALFSDSPEKSASSPVVADYCKEDEASDEDTL